MGSTTEKKEEEEEDNLPYWQVNVPPDQRTAECPEFLRGLGEKDIGILRTPEARFRRDTWAEARRKVADNALHLFQRSPSELRRYLAFAWKLRRDYGSIVRFILTVRLGWPEREPIAPASGGAAAPFAREDDYRVLWNDWPYGIDERIVHLVVWTKFELEEDPATGDLTDAARAAIAGYAHKTFSGRIPEEHVIWFKNWSYLKSVKAVEHFHVMLFNPDPDLVKEITKGDVPWIRKGID